MGLFLNIHILFLAKHQFILQKSVQLYENTFKGFYLSYSGLVYAKVYTDSIATIPNLNKTDISDYPLSFTPVPDLDGMVSVAKSPDYLYSISTHSVDSRTVLRAAYTVDEATQTTILSTIEKF